MRMRGRTELPEASLILTIVKQEMRVGGILQTRTFLAPFGCEEIKVVHGEEEDESAGTLLIPRFQEEADNDEQGPSSSNKDKSEGNDGQGGSRQTEEPMQQDQAGGEDDRASTGGTSSLDFNIFSDLKNNADTLETTEPADEGISTRVEEVMDLGQGDYQLPGTDKMLTDIAMVPPILMAGIKSTGYKSKRSDRTLTGATLEMEILSQCGESTMKDFKPSPMNHGKGSVAGQLTPVEYNRLTVSETVSIDEPTGGYMEMLEYRNSARGYVMALEDEKAMEGYLETMLQGTTLKQKAYGT